MKKILVVLSGGQDSTTCLFWARRTYPEAELHTLTIAYGQRHHAELLAASRVANMAGVPHPNVEYIDVGAVLKGTSPLVNTSEVVEEYADRHSLPGGIEKTFVPMRNQLFLTLAMNRAAVLGCDAIVTGVCQEDFGGYPDCRDDFIKALDRASNIGLEGVCPSITILTPLMRLTKAESVFLAQSLPGCMQALAYSHTCYKGEYPPCGKCHACLLREKGFAVAEVTDPLLARVERESCSGTATGRMSVTAALVANTPKAAD